MSYTNVIKLSDCYDSTDDQVTEIVKLRSVIIDYKRQVEQLRVDLARAETRAKNSEQILREIRG